MPVRWRRPLGGGAEGASGGSSCREIFAAGHGVRAALPMMLGITLGFGQQDCPVFIGFGFDFQRELFPFGAGFLCFTCPFRTHPVINRSADFIWKIDAF